MAENKNTTPPVFWKEDWEGEQAKGGIYFRSFDLNQFIKKIEEKEEVVGIQFDGNNIQLIINIKQEDNE